MKDEISYRNDELLDSRWKHIVIIMFISFTFELLPLLAILNVSLDSFLFKYYWAIFI